MLWTKRKNCEFYKMSNEGGQCKIIWYIWYMFLVLCEENNKLKKKERFYEYNIYFDINIK